jgi:hypothetical protein
VAHLVVATVSIWSSNSQALMAHIWVEPQDRGDPLTEIDIATAVSWNDRVRITAGDEYDEQHIEIYLDPDQVQQLIATLQAAANHIERTADRRR